MIRNKKDTVPKRRIVTRFRLLGLSFLLLTWGALWFWRCLPEPLFDAPTSTVLEDRDGILLGAGIAADEQWRFPLSDQVPTRFWEAITCYEDRRFRHHFGVDPIAIGRAMLENLRSGRIVSGASTISMQVIRLSRKNPPRTVTEKVREALMAIRLEMRYSKAEILALYAAHAPFGGNVVGLEAAAWRYFGRSAHQLTWAEAATLAVLPNNPAMVHPGKNRKRLSEKRNTLLDDLLELGIIDELDCELAKAETLPAAPKPLPMSAFHLHQRLQRTGHQGQRVRTTLVSAEQDRLNQVLARFHRRLVGNGVHNAAALILENRTGAVRAYAGNVGHPFAGDHGAAVDIIHAKRSTGSLLKPFLYASSLADGRLLHQSLVPDVPSHYSGYAPKNFDQTYEGAIPADQALARSINTSAVHLLHDYGLPRFYDELHKLGFNGLDQPPGHYGLALILGGAEGTLWDLAGMYASLARILLTHEETFGRYRIGDIHPPRFRAAVEDQRTLVRQPAVLPAGAVWHTLEALTLVERPASQLHWQYFGSARKIAWKTGTSFGFRDAWAIGVTPSYTVAVWVGNADGEGRPGLTGISTAAPILFEVFGFLKTDREWFQAPQAELTELAVCAASGYRAGPHCGSQNARLVYRQGTRAPRCPHHSRIWLDQTRDERVDGGCESPFRMRAADWFVLPPLQAWYYRKKHPNYRPLPPIRSDCASQSIGQRDNQSGVMAFIYPKRETRLLIPVELDGQPGKAVFQVAHREQQARLFWHLDGEYVGQTRGEHQMALRPPTGKHTLVVVDAEGRRLERRFTVVRGSAGDGGSEGQLSKQTAKPSSPL